MEITSLCDNRKKKKKKETQKFNNLPMCLVMVLKVVAYQASLVGQC